MKILKIVKNCRRIGISGHVNPDGDCVGACCGLALFLRKTIPGAQVDIYLEPMLESVKRNTPGAETVRYEIPENAESYDAFIVLDSIPERIGFAKQLYEDAALKINIDHHKTNPGYGDAFYVDGDASSTCEMVYEIIDTETIDAEIAQALYLGIVMDTGVFQYSNTSESTMRIAGHLITYGFDFTALIREVFFERTFLQAQMLGVTLEKSVLKSNGKSMFSVLDLETVNRYGAARKDFDRISSEMLLTYGVLCAVFLHETHPDEWRCSLRSGRVIDVARTAALFGGGGHTRAAGCTIRTGTETLPGIEEAVKILSEDIDAQFLAASEE